MNKYCAKYHGVDHYKNENQSLSMKYCVMIIIINSLLSPAAKQSKVNQEPSASGAESANKSTDLDIESSRGSKSGTASPSSSVKEPQGEIVNQKALNIIRRVKDKLTGRDFISSSNDRDVNVERQVELLIDQATSHANLCQCYIGWCPFW